jgi:exodeoxyribonuclease VII small subunit
LENLADASGFENPRPREPQNGTNAMASPDSSISETPSFEQTLGRLEEILRLLEEGKIGLDEALARYEEGVGLLRKAYDLLATAERRVLLLCGVDSEGKPILRPIDDAASFSLESESFASGATTAGQEKTGSRRGRRQSGLQSGSDEP